MTSRLDRLVLLLDTGSPSVRSTAADQLADIQKAHPHELYNLLGRVVPFLRYSSWDTRSAAARAIGGILDNAPSWDPDKCEDDAVRFKLELTDEIPVGQVEVTEDQASRTAEDRFAFGTFDVLNVIRNGRPLLGSAGKEYDLKLEALSSEDRLARAKQNINARLGLGAEYMDEELLTPQDLGPQTKSASMPSSPARFASPDLRPMTTEAISQTEDALSARQRNMMKRKAKLAFKGAPNKVRVIDVSGSPASSTNHPLNSDTGYLAVTEQAQNETKVVVEHKRIVDPAASLRAATERNAWPLEAFAEILSVDLFDDNWERRHGAAMALREVLRAHGQGAGRKLGCTRAENDSLNKAYLEDMACRICCIFALDRFGDYVADQVVAPIRETVSQTLAALLKHLPDDSLVTVFDLLCKLVYQNGLGRVIWEVTHGGLLGLKYLVAMRKDTIISNDELLDRLIDVVMSGLGHTDDDVRAVAAATLIPITEQLITKRPLVIENLLLVLWDCLAEMRDDLSASTGSVMDLLAKLCSLDIVIASMQEKAQQDDERTFAKLIPRLFAFFRHTITTVRIAVLRAMSVFVRADEKGNALWVDDRLLQLVFQNLLLEQNDTVLELSFDFWKLCLASYDRNVQPFTSQFRKSLELVTTPVGQGRHSFALDRSLLIRPSGHPQESSASKQGLDIDLPLKRGRKRAEPVSERHTHNIDGAMLDGDVELLGYGAVIKSRCLASRALGLLLSKWPQNQVVHLISTDLKRKTASPASTPRYLSCILMQELLENTSALDIREAVKLACDEQLNPEQGPFYENLVSLMYALRAQCQNLCNIFVELGQIPRDRLPRLGICQQNDSVDVVFGLGDAAALVGAHFDRLRRTMPVNLSATAGKALEQARVATIQALEQATHAKATEDCRVSSAAAGALVATGRLPKKLNPIIKSLMDSTKTETDLGLQKRSARNLAYFVGICHVSGRNNALDKLVKNLCTFLCIDTFKTPEFGRHMHLQNLIYSVFREAQLVDMTATEMSSERQQAATKRLGAKMALQEMAVRFGPSLFEVVPKLEQCIYKPLNDIYGAEPSTDSDFNDPIIGQELVDSMSILGDLIPSFDKALQPQLLKHISLVLRALASKFATIRFAAADCFATLCNTMTIPGMQMTIEDIVPMIGNSANLNQRQGAVEAIHLLVQVMDVAILPYIIFLIVPILGRMSDIDDDIRNLATKTFAQLVKLVPLEAGIPDPPGISEELLAERAQERQFIQQMLDGSKVEHFKIPVAIKADLRSYQQEGVNWLAFLNKYQLHGILCDDMGLGKTLQTICIMASDHHNRKAKYKQTGADDWAPLPSLVVCPPTLTGHWQYEMSVYAPFLNVVSYVGIPVERTMLHASLPKADIVVTSYDIVRNDVEHLCQQDWNYCVLDEGHIIKNSKAKLTQAVKRMKAGHRLILSGTPIQNNVLELWSLFDFLMPGFLGTEKSFYARYAKPIAMSREAKSSSKESESGALALEALHKQVLPFLLRRLKEDVLSDLPPKIIQDYYCDLSPLQKMLYNDFTVSQMQTIASETTDSGNTSAKTHVFQALQYMRKLCNHPALVLNEKHSKYASTMNMLKSQRSTLRDIKHGPKLLALRDLLVDCGLGTQQPEVSPLDIGVVNQHRALIFCQLKDMLDMVENEVLKKLLPNVSYMRLDGSTDPRDRQSAVQKFNADPSIDVLLLTTHVGGLGLNLTGADTVIFVEHDWNPMKDLQAMDRAHRLGQKKTVNVYRIITKNTLEEKIMGLQSFKLNIASTVVNQQNSGLATMGTDQILDLFNTKDVAEKKSSTHDTGLDSQGNVITSGKGKALFDDLPELHERSEYADFGDLSAFVSSL